MWTWRFPEMSSAVEYWCEGYREEPEPFDLAEVNRKLAALGQVEKWNGTAGDDPR